MNIYFIEPICKTGIKCDSAKEGRCCAIDQPNPSLRKKKLYTVYRIIVKDTGTYYELEGWGSLLFNALCFEIEPIALKNRT